MLVHSQMVVLVEALGSLSSDDTFDLDGSLTVFGVFIPLIHSLTLVLSADLVYSDLLILSGWLVHCSIMVLSKSMVHSSSMMLPHRRWFTSLRWCCRYSLVHSLEMVLSTLLVHLSMMILSVRLVHSLRMVLSYPCGSLLHYGTFEIDGSLCDNGSLRSLGSLSY